MATCPIVDDDSPTCVCPLTGIIEVLGNKYAMQLICVVGNHDRLRFSEIEAHVPEASTSTVSDRLDELETAGIVDREQFDEVPPRVEYRLTAKGEELGERLRPLLEWVEADA